MSEFPDSLISLRRLSFDRAAAEAEQAACEFRNSQDLLVLREEETRSLEARRISVSDRLSAENAAHILIQTWTYDRLLAEDLAGAREEAGRAESGLAEKQENLSEKRRALKATQARLVAAQNLKKRRRRDFLRRQERHLEEQAADFHRARRS